MKNYSAKSVTLLSSIEKFEDKADELGTHVEIISTDTREGVQLKEIGKVAAILRYNV